MRSKSAAAVVLSLLSLSARADTIGDLKATLNRLQGRESIHASFDVTRARHAKGRFLTENFQGVASVDVDGDAGGVHLSISRATLDRAAEEQAAKAVDGKRAAPTSSVLEEIVPISVSNAVSAAQPLLRLVERGTVVEQRVEAFMGKQARVVVLKLPKTTGGSESGGVNVEDDRLTVWVGPDNVPLAAERVRSGKIGIMLLHADTFRREHWTYVVRGDRLCTWKLEDHSSVNGLGQDGDATSVWMMHS